MKITSLLLALALGAAPAFARDAAPAAPNLAANGDFELNAKNETPPQDWYFFGAPDAATVLTWDASQKHGGDHSLKVSSADAAVYPNVFQSPKLSPGKYHFSAWVKGDGLKGSVGDEGAALYMESFSKGGDWLRGEYAKPLAGTFDWTKVESTFTVRSDAGNNRLALYLRKGTTGTAWFDDVTLEAVK